MQDGELPPALEPGEVPEPIQPPRPLNPDPVLPGSKRMISITPRYGAPFQPTYRQNPDGSTTIVVRGGVQIVAEMKRTKRKDDEPETYRIDLAADNAVIWIGPSPKKGGAATLNLGGAPTAQNAEQPMEVYLEGDVVVRQDDLKMAGQNDQRIIRAKHAYYDFRTERMVGYDAEFDFFAPGLVAPLKSKGKSLDQYRQVQGLNPDGTFNLGPTHVMVDQTMTTGSRFPNPGYKFNSQSVDITQIDKPLTDPFSGTLLRLRGQPVPTEQVWEIDARQNTYFIGPVPFFYWPRIVMTDDFDPPLRNIAYRYGSYFGHQILLDFSVFKLLGQRKPQWIDTWNLDVDYLSMRGPALGTEVGWFGRDILGDLTDPYGRNKNRDKRDQPYFGYFDAWGIRDTGEDVLGSHPAVVTYGPPGAGKRGYDRSKVPTFRTYRGRVMFRHMQSLLPEDAPAEDDMRVQIEAGGYSDRHFLEEYYKRLFDSGLDQDTLVYGIWQHQNQAATLTSQVNIMDWITDTQYLPKAEYYRLGDNLFDGLLTYSQNSGADYANVHTAVEVNNPNIFNFMPYDPVSNTSGPWSSGRFWTTQELQMPLDFSYFRIIPYAQGQLMGWDNQLGNVPLGRAWGGAGARLNFMLWKTWSSEQVHSELLNIHGLAHKVNFDADFRTTYSNVNLSRIGIQSNYDDDTYEFVRRYFALDNYIGGVLPMQYDPRFLTMRRALDPTVFTSDIQGNMQTLQLGIHQRLQTKRGPEGKRRIVDYMILDLQTTYFPNELRDNFGKSFGQNFYNFEWFVGDRTSIVSTGWFEFWKINGNNRFTTYDPGSTNNPFGLNVVTAGVSINRPPRGSV
ncbi:MAG TPA: hypothetical protein VFT74_16785, partial [Isosphaeraceae bacterium]|nr:hypothetical protein [Isosphaeraceae bacterium]